VAFAEGPWPDKAYWDAMGHARRRDAGTFLNYGWTRPRVFSQGPIPQGYHGGYEYESEGQMFYNEYGEEVPPPQPTPAGTPGAGIPAEPISTPTPAGPTTADYLRLAPPRQATRPTSGSESPGAIGSGVLLELAARGNAAGASTGGESVRAVSFEWDGLNVPPAGANATFAEPARLSQQPVSNMQPLQAKSSDDAWKAKQ
jgi:hypothetical protein